MKNSISCLSMCPSMFTSMFTFTWENPQKQQSNNPDLSLHQIPECVQAGVEQLIKILPPSAKYRDAPIYKIIFSRCEGIFMFAKITSSSQRLQTYVLFTFNQNLLPKPDHWRDWNDTRRLNSARVSVKVGNILRGGSSRHYKEDPRTSEKLSKKQTVNYTEPQRHHLSVRC